MLAYYETPLHNIILGGSKKASVSTTFRAGLKSCCRDCKVVSKFFLSLIFFFGCCSVSAVYVPDILPILGALIELLVLDTVHRSAARDQERTVAIRGDGTGRRILAGAVQYVEALKVLVGHGRLIVAAEDADLKVSDLACAVDSLHAGLLEVLKGLEHKGVALNQVGHVLQRAAVREELGRVGQINTVDVRVSDFGAARYEDDALRLALLDHLDNLARGCAAHNAVVDEAHDLVLELGRNGRQLAAHALLPCLLAGQDKCAVDVTVLDEAVGEGLGQRLGQRGGGRVARLGNRDDDVNVLDHVLAEHLAHALRQLQAHVLPAAVDGDAVHTAVGSRKVQVLEQVGRVRLGRHDLREAGGLALLDEDSLAGQDVDNVLEAQLDEGNGFGGEEVVGGALEGLGWPRAEAEGADAVLVTEAQDAEAGQHSRAGKGADAARIDLAQGGEDVVNVSTGLAELAECMCEDVEPKWNPVSKRNGTSKCKFIC